MLNLPQKLLRNDRRRPLRRAFDRDRDQISLVHTQPLSEVGVDEGVVPPVACWKGDCLEGGVVDGGGNRNLPTRAEELSRCWRQLEPQPAASLGAQLCPEPENGHDPILPRTTAVGRVSPSIRDPSGQALLRLLIRELPVTGRSEILPEPPALACAVRVLPSSVGGTCQCANHVIQAEPLDLR